MCNRHLSSSRVKGGQYEEKMMNLRDKKLLHQKKIAQENYYNTD
jgi:hypothetical protein